MAAVIANVVSTLEIQHGDQVRDVPKFKEAKAMVQRVTEIYRSFGASAFGFGAHVGKSNSTSQPIVIPTQVLSRHLEDIATWERGLHFVSESASL